MTRKAHLGIATPTTYAVILPWLSLSSVGFRFFIYKIRIKIVGSQCPLVEDKRSYYRAHLLFDLAAAHSRVRMFSQSTLSPCWPSINITFTYSFSTGFFFLFALSLTSCSADISSKKCLLILHICLNLLLRSGRWAPRYLMHPFSQSLSCYVVIAPGEHYASYIFVSLVLNIVHGKPITIW